jgi:hypothetical protein
MIGSTHDRRSERTQRRPRLDDGSEDGSSRGAAL